MQKKIQNRLMYGAVIGITTADNHKVIQFLKEGLPTSSFTKLQNALAISSKQLASVVNISLRTINRRQKEGNLRPDESERVLRIARLFDMARELFEDDQLARQWFKSPKRALDGKTPLDFAVTEPGAQEVADLLGRLKHGVFS